MRVNAKSVEHFEGAKGIVPRRRVSALHSRIMAPKRLRHGGKGVSLISVCAALTLLLFPFAAHPLDLTERDNGKGVSVAVGETISLTLAGNPTTGYMWEMADIDRAVLAPGPGPAFAADSSLTGAGGTFTFRLSALKAGSSAVKLSYRRPWETGVPPLRRVEFTVTVLPPEPRITTACYRSRDGKMAEARFDLDRDLVSVTLPDGRNVTLAAALSASGARYTDGRETFWEHQGSGRFFRGAAGSSGARRSCSRGCSRRTAARGPARDKLKGYPPGASCGCTFLIAEGTSGSRRQMAPAARQGWSGRPHRSARPRRSELRQTSAGTLRQETAGHPFRGSRAPVV